MTPHISAAKGDIAKKTILFGDPVRCKRAAQKFLQDPKEVSSVRGALFYTGKYNGKEVTLGTSGMGSGSMGIYSYELFKFYEVDTIIRVGTSGAYSTLDVGDKVLVSKSVPDSPTFSVVSTGTAMDTALPTPEVMTAIRASADKLGVKLHECVTHSSDVFYFVKTIEEVIQDTGACCVEMESYALLVNAARTNKKAAVLLTITDSIYGGKHLTPDERVVCCDQLIQVALDIEV